MASNQSNWKGVERKIAGIMGGERVPVSGRTGEKGQESADVDHQDWSIEIKARGPGIVPAWMRHAMNQAQKSRKETHLGAIVIMHEKGKRHDDDLVMMTFADFMRLQEML